MKEAENLQALLVDELKDLYSAEKQILKALPKLIRKAESAELANALRDHMAQTEHQVQRLDNALGQLDSTGRGKKCKGMEGLLEEGSEMIDMKGDPDVIDAGIIGAAQKVEHYEIAAYGTAVAHARVLGRGSVERLLQQTLDEDKEADARLTDVAEGFINRLASATPAVSSGVKSRGRSRTRHASEVEEIRL